MIALATSAVGTVLWLVLGACLIAYVSTHPPRKPLKRTPAQFSAAFEEVQFPSRDGKSLSGWFLPARALVGGEIRPPGAVILCHGMMSNRAEGLFWAEALWERGFTLLLFDFRAYGESDSALCTIGYHEVQDLHGAVDYMMMRPEAAGLPLGVFGFSMGGAIAIMTAADDTRIQAVVTHGAYATLTGAILQRCRHHFGPLGPLVAWMTIKFGMRWFPIQPSEVSPVEAVSRIAPRPLLLLHGKHDPIILAEDARELYAAAGSESSLRVLPHSGHRRIHRDLQQAVRRRVAHFFTVALQSANPEVVIQESSGEVRASHTERESGDRSQNAARN